MDNIQLELEGLALLENWIQKVFERFPIYGFDAKANIPTVIGELDHMSAQYLSGLSAEQIVKMFIVSLKLRGYQVMNWTLKKNGETQVIYASVLSSPESTPASATLVIGLAIDATVPEGNLLWEVFRPAQDDEERDALQRILVALASLAFTSEYIEGIESVDRRSSAILEQTVTGISYSQTIRYRIRSIWNGIQRSKEKGSPYLL